MNSELYIPTFEQANEILNNSEVGDIDADGGDKLVYTSIIIQIVFNTSALNRLVLSELTGIDLGKDENLYEYLIKSIKMDKEKAMEFAITTLGTIGLKK